LNFGSTDAGAAVIAAADMANGNASTLTVASDNVKLLQPIASGGTLEFQANDANLYDLAVVDSNAALIARASIGSIGGRNQVYMDVAQGNDLMVSSITAVAGGNVQVLKPLAVSSIVGVSTINGTAYPPSGGGGGLTNTITPWVPGFSLGGQRFLNVDSNTIASPIGLTNPVPALSNHSYLVSYNLSSGSNADNSQPTVVTLAIPPANAMFYASYAGNGTYDFQTTGQTGNRTAIIRGASSIQLLAGCGSATASTLMVLDDTQQFQITDLGVSS
jgi:hypothetical protein